MSAPETAAAKAELRSWADAVRAQAMGWGAAAADPSPGVAKKGPSTGPTAAALNAAVAAAVRGAAAYRAARTVATYRAFGSEVDLSALLADEGKSFAFPRVRASPAPHLTFHALTDPRDPSAWERHRFGQLEPREDSPTVRPEELDLVLVPGLAFDRRGYRLGYGKGYYDRFLPLLRPEAVVVGVTLDVLVLPELPRHEHDVRLGYLVTESGWRAAEATSAQVG